WWWDLEFWNESADRAAYVPGQFLWTPSTFPRVMLRFDPRTGLANASPSPYVVQSNKETRFRIAGTSAGGSPDTRDSSSVPAANLWRAAWVSYGMYDDGWTRPRRVARVRLFAAAGQTHPVIRTLTLGVQAPVASRPFTVVSNRQRFAGTATNGDRVLLAVTACVPAHGFTDVRISTPGASVTYGD